MRTIEVWLVRHGETTVNQGIWSEKHTEARLTPKGLAQAKHCAEQVMTPPNLFIVSPLIRARETIRLFQEIWFETPVLTMPIQEFIYLSPKRLAGMNERERRTCIKNYWQKLDPFHCDGEDAESFADFLSRVSAFHKELLNLRGYTVVVGHGQFFKAFLLGLVRGYRPTADWMRWYRQQETLQPIKNGEIVKLSLSDDKFVYKRDAGEAP